jgi:hypothetical protein
MRVARFLARNWRPRQGTLQRPVLGPVVPALPDAWGAETRSGGELVFVDEAAEEVAPAQGR